jgi:hypothetical protein
VKCFTVATGDDGPGRIIEQRIVRWSIVGPVPPTHSEAHGVRDAVCEVFELLTGARGSTAKIAEIRIGPNRRIPARNVESDPRDRHRILVGRHAADRHHVAQVPIGHQRDLARVPRDLLQLGTSAFIMRSEDSHG